MSSLVSLPTDWGPCHSRQISGASSRQPTGNTRNSFSNIDWISWDLIEQQNKTANICLHRVQAENCAWFSTIFSWFTQWIKLNFHRFVYFILWLTTQNIITVWATILSALPVLHNTFNVPFLWKWNSLSRKLRNIDCLQWRNSRLWKKQITNTST